MRPSSTARRYAEAAFEIAQEEGATEAWLNDLRTAERLAGDPQLSRYFRDPNIPRETKLQTADQVFAGLRPHVLNLLRLLVTRFRLHLLPNLVHEFETLQRDALGIVDADVTVARSISDAERDAIARRLAEVTGKQVHMATQVDPAILGGIVVRMGDRLIDASVAGRLQRLRQELAV